MLDMYGNNFYFVPFFSSKKLACCRPSIILFSFGKMSSHYKLYCLSSCFLLWLLACKYLPHPTVEKHFSRLVYVFLKKWNKVMGILHCIQKTTLYIVCTFKL